MSPFALGLDLGGTHTRAAVVDRSTGKVVTSVKDTHADKTPEGVVASMAKVAAAAAKQAGVTEPLPCGVGAAAQLNGDIITLAPNLGWRNIPFGALLGKAFGRRVTVVNDLKAAAWGEFTAGVAKGETDAYTLFVGSGVGSAIISGGRMVLGNTGLAGEVGHLKIVFEGGRKCGCGELGCLEAYAGGVSMEGWMKESGLKGGAMELEIAAHAGDPVAMKLWDFASASLALVVANQVTVLNPGCVVLGGGVLMRCPMMVQRIEKTVAARALASSRVGLKVGLAALGDDAGVVGAAMLALDA